VRSSRASLIEVVIGLGTAYLFDPHRGRRRRHVLRDRTAALTRRANRLAERKVRFAGGHLRGLVAVLRSVFSEPTRPEDETVVQRIRSDAFRDSRISTRDVQVEVQNGVAMLRGSVGSRSLADDLVARVRKVRGVRGVSDLIRISGG
jgi:hypothetical protein